MEQADRVDTEVVAAAEAMDDADDGMKRGCFEVGSALAPMDASSLEVLTLLWLQIYSVAPQ